MCIRDRGSFVPFSAHGPRIVLIRWEARLLPAISSCLSLHRKAPQSRAEQRSLDWLQVGACLVLTWPPRSRAVGEPLQLRSNQHSSASIQRAANCGGRTIAPEFLVAGAGGERSARFLGRAELRVEGDRQADRRSLFLDFQPGNQLPIGDRTETD